MYSIDHLTGKTAKALEKFIASQPPVVVTQIHEITGGDRDRGTAEFTKLFMRVSDYAKREYAWIHKRMDSVEVVFTKKKVTDPNSLESMMGMSGGMGGCDCGQCS